jgi:hypothetical protein
VGAGVASGNGNNAVQCTVHLTPHCAPVPISAADRQSSSHVEVRPRSTDYRSEDQNYSLQGRHSTIRSYPAVPDSGRRATRRHDGRATDAAMNTSLRETRRLRPGADKHLSGVFNTKVKDSFVTVGDKYRSSNGDSYSLARGKQMSGRAPNQLFSQTSFNAVGDAFEKRTRRDSRLHGKQFEVSRSRSVGDTLGEVRFNAIGDPYRGGGGGVGLRSKGKQMYGGPAPSVLSVDGAIGGVRSYISIGDKYGAHLKDSYPLARGKQFETAAPKIATRHDIAAAPLGQDGVFEPRYLRLFEGERYRNNTGVRIQQRMAETRAKDQRTLERSQSLAASGSYIAASGLPTLSCERSFLAEARRDSVSIDIMYRTPLLHPNPARADL